MTSIPGIGPTQAAAIIASIGNIANFDQAAQLRSYFGWAPKISQSGYTLDHVRLTPRGQQLMKQTVYLVVWQAIRLKESTGSKMYEYLVPIKCSFNEKTRKYVGRGKVVGRIAEQMISVLFTLLKLDQETLSKTPSRTKLPDPALYDPEVHRQHRAGHYRASPREKPRKLMQLPPH